jgi:hypothetical protein
MDFPSSIDSRVQITSGPQFFIVISHSFDNNAISASIIHGLIILEHYSWESKKKNNSFTVL